jgi:dienelactone hydrolase
VPPPFLMPIPATAEIDSVMILEYKVQMRFLAAERRMGFSAPCAPGRRTKTILELRTRAKEETSVPTVILFHSVYGLRPVELGAADHFRSSGHEVITPDLYACRTASSVDQGFELMNQSDGLSFARGPRGQLPTSDMTVLAGISMGAGVVASLWAGRPKATGVLLLHGLADIPDVVRDGFPVQVHLADPHAFTPAGQISEPRTAH